MARTVADVTARVRSVLKDSVAPLRYEDEDILNAINDALLEVRRIRPDLYIAKKFRVPLLVNPTDNLPIEDMFFNSIVYFVVGYMMLRDDEHIDQRANQLLAKATAQLLAVAS